MTVSDPAATAAAAARATRKAAWRILPLVMLITSSATSTA